MSSPAFVASPSAPPTPQHVAALRAIVALLWAAAIGIAAGGVDAELSAGLALAVTAYPLIDVIVSLVEASRGGAAASRLRAGAAVSGVAVIGLAIASFGAGVGAVLAVFGAWAVVSGLLQLAEAVLRRRAGSQEVPMLVSGALSALAGISFIAASGQDDPNLAVLAGYAAVGALLFLVWARTSRGHR